MFYEGCTLEELKAYRNLESEIFDFGEGPMEIEGLLGSEDAYYKMDIQNLELLENETLLDDLDDLENQDNLLVEQDVKRIDRDNNLLVEQDVKRIDRDKKFRGRFIIKKLDATGVWPLVNHYGTHLERIYRGKRSAYIKKRANKTVRKAKNIANRGGYKKAFELAYEMW